MTKRRWQVAETKLQTISKNERTNGTIDRLAGSLHLLTERLTRPDEYMMTAKIHKGTWIRKLMGFPLKKCDEEEIRCGCSLFSIERHEMVFSFMPNNFALLLRTLRYWRMLDVCVLRAKYKKTANQHNDRRKTIGQAKTGFFSFAFSLLYEAQAEQLIVRRL